MAKNRKSQSAANRFGPAIKALVICLLIGGSGIGYVWQKEQIIRLGQEIKRREVRRSALEDQNDKLRKQLGNIRSPAWIEARIKQLNLGLLPPQQAQVWRLPEPSTNSPAPAIPFSGKEYALHSRAPAGRR